MQPLTRGTVAKKVGVGIEAIRFYEQKGLIPKPSRNSSGYRQYPDHVIRRLQFIQRAKELGFSLREISELLSLRVDPKMTCADVKKQAEQKIEAISIRMRELRRIQKALTKLANACRGKGPTSECPILEALDSKE